MEGQHGYQLTRSRYVAFIHVDLPAKRASTFDRDSINPSYFPHLYQVILSAFSGHYACIVHPFRSSYLHRIIRSSCLRADHRISGSEDIALSLVCYTQNRIRHKKRASIFITKDLMDTPRPPYYLHSSRFQSKVNPSRPPMAHSVAYTLRP